MASRKLSVLEGQTSLFASAEEPPLVRRDALLKEMAGCTACPREKYRERGAFFRGTVRSPAVLFVGEAPSFSDDRVGEAFAGPAGRELESAMRDAGIDPDVVAYVNAVGCAGLAPPSSRELGACSSFLKRWVALLSPRVIVALGTVGAGGVLGRSGSLSNLRDRWFTAAVGSAAVRVTFHPNAILTAAEGAAEALRRELVADLSAVAARLTIVP